jgi:hypothetical protein
MLVGVPPPAVYATLHCWLSTVNRKLLFLKRGRLLGRNPNVVGMIRALSLPYDYTRMKRGFVDQSPREPEAGRQQEQAPQSDGRRRLPLESRCPGVIPSRLAMVSPLLV